MGWSSGGLLVEVTGGKTVVSGARGCHFRRRFHRSLYSICNISFDRRTRIAIQTNQFGVSLAYNEGLKKLPYVVSTWKAIAAANTISTAHSPGRSGITQRPHTVCKALSVLYRTCCRHTYCTEYTHTNQAKPTRQHPPDAVSRPHPILLLRP